MSSCPQCGASAGPADRFCGGCGSTLSAGATAAPTDGPVEVPAAGGTSLDAAGEDDVVSVGPEPAGVSTSDEDGQPNPVESAAHDAMPPAPSRDGAAAAPARESEPESEPEAADELTDEVVAPAGAADEGEPSNESATGGGPVRVEVLSEDAATPATDAGAGEVGQRGGAATGGVSGAGGSGDRLPPGSTARASGARGGSTGRLRNIPKALEAETLLHSRYQIVRRIGGGGMGAVYLARDKNLGDAPRAVKEMIQQNIDESQHEKAINDFRRESMLLSSLEHQSIPTIYDYFYDDDSSRFYLVMKYISGGDFLARLRSAPNGRLDEKTVADWGCQVADVLYYLHRQNPPIIYRDLKPANLMIDGNSGRVMLIDFGIARWVQKEEKGVTAVGTMGYAPPELFSGKVEPRSDIYSLGATLFHLATGSDPQDNPLLIFDFNKNPRPRAIAPSLSNEMEAILMRAVEYKPEGRFRSAAELRDTLADHLEKLRTGQVTYGSISGAGQSAGLKTMQTEMVYCGFCGGRIAGDDVYCAHCGQRQPMAVASAALRQARATAKLVVTGTTELDSSFHLQKESSLIGRSDPHSNIFPEIDLSPFDPQTKISRRHARVFRRGDVYLVEDLGSINGTIINDSVRLAPHQPRALESGDKLRLGETTLHFLIA